MRHRLQGRRSLIAAHAQRALHPQTSMLRVEAWTLVRMCLAITATPLKRQTPRPSAILPTRERCMAMADERLPLRTQSHAHMSSAGRATKHANPRTMQCTRPRQSTRRLRAHARTRVPRCMGWVYREPLAPTQDTIAPLRTGGPPSDTTKAGNLAAVPEAHLPMDQSVGTLPFRQVRTRGQGHPAFTCIRFSRTPASTTPR